MTDKDSGEDQARTPTRSDATAANHPGGASRRDDGIFPGYQGSYGSIVSYNTAPFEQAPDETRGDGLSTPERGLDSRLGSRASSIRQLRRSGDQGGIEGKAPSVTRRASSYAQIPHRGQGFSVDDDPAEIEAALARRQAAAASAATGRGTLRKQPSTLRRRGTVQPITLPRVDSTDEGDDVMQDSTAASLREVDEEARDDSEGDGTIRPDDVPDENRGDDDDDDDDDDDSEVSDAESFTLKDRQQAINETHPFGIRVWKPALYKKSRSVQKSAEGDIHSSPGGHVNNWIFVFNVMWSIFFGWWLACAAAVGGAACFLLGWTFGGVEYGQVLLALSGYVLYPFGKFVRLHQDDAYAEEDEGEGRSISEYEQWQSGDLEDGRLFFGPSGRRSLIGRRRNSMESASENDSLLGRTWGSSNRDRNGARTKRRLFGRGEWNLGRVIFYVVLYGLITPLMLLASLICWLLVFWIPMGKITMLLYSHLRRHPLALSFHAAGAPSRGTGSPSSSILLCTYRAAGLKYWKYTIDGTNIILINLMSLVAFVIFDYYILDVTLHVKVFITHPALIFLLSLFSIIPLAYFIGQAVASISAQSTMGVGAAINAFFSTVVEVYLYCVALAEGKGRLVEGSIIGSIFAGILFLPGISMCFGALKRKTQRFNARSAGVTSTMLLFAVIAAFSPTLFYQIYGTHELNCQSCIDTDEHTTSRDCRRCHFSQVPAINDRFFYEAVRPYCFAAAILLFLSYVIGLWFTLRTHAAVIWSTETDEKKAIHQDMTASGIDHAGPGESTDFAANGSASRNASYEADALPRSSIRDSQLYKKIIGQALKQSGIGSGRRGVVRANTIATSAASPHIVPPREGGGGGGGSGEGSGMGSSALMHIPGLSEQESRNLAREVVEVAATAAVVAARDVGSTPMKAAGSSPHASGHLARPSHARATPLRDDEDAGTVENVGHGGGGGGAHDAPNWSRMKSTVILLGATLLYAIIAEILVNTVDVVLDNVDIDEKFLGITLFALVPNTTEFLNAISFAMNGNIALSMEIGSAYALQVCLLQIPALVLYSAVRGHFISSADDVLMHTFSLIFPQWDMITVTLCVFLLSYMYGEGKSNYFKGSILLLSYLVVIMGFYLSGKTALAEDDDAGAGMSRFDPYPYPSTTTTPGRETFKVVGRGGSGRAW